MFLKNLFNKSYPRLDWIQVEVSSICNAECIYCPHTEYSSNWQSRLLPLELYKRLIPAFKKTKLVYLQGWGEPFTHPHFMEFLRLAKKAGCMVGTTTNGTLLDSDKISELIDEGIDVIAFSLAGIDEKNDSIRRGTRITKVLKCIDEIHRIKAGKSVDNPRIHIAYMLLRSGLDEMRKLPAFLDNIGVDQTVISSLSFVVNEEMVKEALLDTDLNIIETNLKPVSTNTGIAYNIVSPHMEESRCSENIERALVVGSDGSVSPCVIGVIPVSGDNHYFFKGNRMRLENMTFGNISDESLNSIWHKKEYSKFHRFHRDNNFRSLCQTCNKRFIMDFL